MKINIIAIILISFSLTVVGQKTKIKESVEKIGEGKNNALIVNINGADENTVIKAWKSKMKSSGAKVSGKRSMFADDAIIVSISSNSIDIYSEISEKNEYIELMVAYNLGGAYLNSKEHASSYKAAEKIMYDFAVSQAKEAIKNQVDEQKNVIGKLEKQQGNFEKDNEKQTKNIENYKRQIEEAESTIESNKSEIANTIKELETENETLKNLEKKLKEVD